MTSEFASDCSNCAALCCMAFAFDEGEMFGHDKPAGLPCHNLEGFSCAIHARLSEAGYLGCVAFECLGAGQKVTALFTQTWRDQPRLARPMIEAFRQMRDVQELRQMLKAAAALPLPEAVEAERQAWDTELMVATQALAPLAVFNPAPLRAWLKGLAAHVSR